MEEIRRNGCLALDLLSGIVRLLLFLLMFNFVGVWGFVMFIVYAQIFHIRLLLFSSSVWKAQFNFQNFIHRFSGTPMTQTLCN